MKGKLGKISVISIVAILIFSFLTVLPVYASPGARIYMEPSENVFETETTSPCYKWNLTFYVEDVTNLFAFQVYLDITGGDDFLNVTEAWLPTWHPEYVFKGLGTVMPAPAIYDVDFDGNNDAAKVADTILVGSPVDVAAGDPKVLGIIELHIKKAPEEGKTLSCVLDIDNIDTFLLDFYLEDIPLTKENGSFTYRSSVPTITDPYLAVQPDYIKFTEYTEAVCKYFDIEVKIMNLSLGLALINASISLCYNTTLIDTEPANITTGSLWTGGNTVNVTHGDPDRVDIFVQNPSTTPSGDVLIATIKFHVKYQGEYPAVDESSLELCDYKLMNQTAEILTLEPVHGRVVIKGYRGIVGDINGDGKVNIHDLVEAAKAFGSYGPDLYPDTSAHLRWNPDADINKDNKVDIRDLVLVARDFGKSL